MKRPFLFLAANTPWVYALARELAKSAPVTTFQYYDLANYLRLNPKWPEEGSRIRRRRIVMPAGYAGKLEFFFRPIMRRAIENERRRLTRAVGAAPVLIAPYPYLAPWLRHVPSEEIVYFNLDNYDLYRPRYVNRTRELEDELIDRAHLTLCLSNYQTSRLRSRNKTRSSRIRHFPLGVEDNYINPDPDAGIVPWTVGYVGNLGDRVDWSLVGAVADLMPEVTFHFVGFATGPSNLVAMTAWQRARREAFARPNIIHEGGVPQTEVREHYWRYAVNWMPYRVDHPFNLAACPTKIMDAMASGRPFVSTPVPEVKLYPEHIAIAPDAVNLALELRAALESPANPKVRVEFAKGQSWEVRAQQLHDLILQEQSS